MMLIIISFQVFKLCNIFTLPGSILFFVFVFETFLKFAMIFIKRQLSYISYQGDEYLLQ